VLEDLLQIYFGLGASIERKVQLGKVGEIGWFIRGSRVVTETIIDDLRCETGRRTSHLGSIRPADITMPVSKLFFSFQKRETNLSSTLNSRPVMAAEDMMPIATTTGRVSMTKPRAQAMVLLDTLRGPVKRNPRTKGTATRCPCRIRPTFSEDESKLPTRSRHHDYPPSDEDRFPRKHLQPSLGGKGRHTTTMRARTRSKFLEAHSSTYSLHLGETKGQRLGPTSFAQ
jgi:hypothetical protein